MAAQLFDSLEQCRYSGALSKGYALREISCSDIRCNLADPTRTLLETKRLENRIGFAISNKLRFHAVLTIPAYQTVDTDLNQLDVCASTGKDLLFSHRPRFLRLKLISFFIPMPDIAFDPEPSLILEHTATILLSVLQASGKSFGFRLICMQLWQVPASQCPGGNMADEAEAMDVEIQQEEPDKKKVTVVRLR